MKALALTSCSLMAVLAGCATDDNMSHPGDATALSAGEIAGLRYTREEEKLARDVYAVMPASGQMFANIGASEQRHFDAIGALLVTYAIEDPAAGRGPGSFLDPTLAALYPDLVQRGTPGGTSALVVGCTIEDLDLHDLATAQTTVTHADVTAVYDNLALGSRNHLRAFYSNLIASGGSYTPAYIDQATFDAIVTSPHEQGSN